MLDSALARRPSSVLPCRRHRPRPGPCSASLPPTKPLTTATTIHASISIPTAPATTPSLISDITTAIVEASRAKQWNLAGRACGPLPDLAQPRGKPCPPHRHDLRGQPGSGGRWQAAHVLHPGLACVFVGLLLLPQFHLPPVLRGAPPGVPIPSLPFLLCQNEHPNPISS
jgi:hypothetical protein